PEIPDERGNTRILLKKYLWKAFFTDRYDRAVPTAILQDYRVLRKVIMGEAKEADETCVKEYQNPLPIRNKYFRVSGGQGKGKEDYKKLFGFSKV
ncbi:unnamed protein product, partial [marine sediment metagenome]